MNDDRIEQAARRIESALGRIAELAERINPAPPTEDGAETRHTKLRDAVTNSLKELDEILERLDK